MRCPLCDSEKVDLVYSENGSFFTDGISSLELFSVSTCLDCTFVFQVSAYSSVYDEIVDNLYSNYSANTYFEFPRKDKKTIESLEFLSDNLNIDKNWNILEIGSGVGDFLYLLREKYGANIIGIEPSNEQQSRVPTVGVSFEDGLFSSKFDLVILKHTLEHIKYPKLIIEALSRLIEDNGYLFIEVPSFDVVSKHYLGDFIPDHVSYFSKNSLQKLFSGFSMIHVDNKHFLRAIFQLDKTNRHIDAYDNINMVLDFFKDFNLKKDYIHNFLISESKNDNMVIFYGAGLYFRTVFGVLESRINKQNCYFVDDGLDEDTEPVFGLKRANLETIDGKVVIVASTNDYTVQNIIKDKAHMAISNFTFVHLYEKIEYIEREA